jgi:hypothetical protein
MSQPDPPLDAPSWPQLQALRRGALPVQPWIEGLASGVVAPDPLLLAALWGRLDRPAVERLLGSSLGLDPTTLLAAGRSELPLLAGEPAVQDAWLEALLAHQQSRPAAEAPAWLELLGQFRHPLVAARLRPLVDELVALAEVAGLMAVGAWYERFEQLDDAQVKALMAAGKRDQPSSVAALPPRGTEAQP